MSETRQHERLTQVMGQMVRERADMVMRDPEDALSVEVLIGLLSDLAEGKIGVSDVHTEFTGRDRARLAFPLMADPELKPLLDYYLDRVFEQAAIRGLYVETNWGTFTMDELLDARADIVREPSGRTIIRFREAERREVPPLRYSAPW